MSIFIASFLLLSGMAFAQDEIFSCTNSSHTEEFILAKSIEMLPTHIENVCKKIETSEEIRLVLAREMKYVDEGEFEKATSLLRHLANLKNQEAQLLLGAALLSGKKISKTI